ncbi:MAG: ABC transporter permease [Actinomycetes bacterium]
MNTDAMREKIAKFSWLVGNPYAIVASSILVIFLACAAFSTWLAPYPKEGAGAPNVAHTLIGPSRLHLLGTDELGRDLLSRIIYGARPALLTSLTVVGTAALVGTLLGLVAGFRGGLIDAGVMRLSELFLSFPPLLLSLVAVSLLGPGLRNALIALIVSWWPWYARLIRNESRSLKSQPFVEIAQAMGVSSWKVMTRHLLRNITSSLIVQIAADLGTVILAAGSLAFIGLGAQPPSSDWGLMVAQGRTVIFDQWWISTFAGLAIFIVVLAFNLLGDELRDYLDPRKRAK